MIAVHCDWGGHGARLDRRLAASLGLFAGAAANYLAEGAVSFAQLSGPRGKPRAGWRPAEAASGTRVLFNGYLDNAATLAAELGLPPTASPQTVYAAALDRWADGAELRCIGVYCSIAVPRGGHAMRLARSPYDGPPMHYYHDADQAIAASVPRALFAVGVPRKLAQRRLIHNLLYYHSDEELGWYEGLREVRSGTVVHLTATGPQVIRYYDPAAFAGRTVTCADAPEQAFALLTEAARAVSASMARPAMLLSGGLDSPLAATAMLEAMPQGRPLDTFTFTPCAQWDGLLEPGKMGNERPLVEAFAAQHPRIRPHFFSNEGIGFDYRSQELFAATDMAPAGLANFYMYHALWKTAADQGCDGVVTADFGNFSYSTEAAWAGSEYFLTGRWSELRRSLQARPGDTRSWLRRFVALSLMPQLPMARRRALRVRRGAPRTPLQRHFTALNPKLLGSADAHRDDGTPLDPFEGHAPRDHAQFVEQWLDGDMANGSDINQGFEQLYGIRRRDVTLYRPLIEFCLSLPIDEFELGGENRRLARRMGRGRLPEAIRANPRYGRHGVDWHARMGPQRADLIEELRRYAGDPELAGLLNLDRAIAALEDWPEQTTYDMEKHGAYLGVVMRSTLTARFVNWVEGRNRP